MDRCEWKAWFQAHHDGRTWTRIDSGLNQVKYNIAHTELMRRCTDGLEERGFDVAVEHQNEFRLKLQGATISGRPDLVAARGDEALIVDAKAALPRPGPPSAGYALHHAPAVNGRPVPRSEVSRPGILRRHPCG